MTKMFFLQYYQHKEEMELSIEILMIIQKSYRTAKKKSDFM